MKWVKAIQANGDLGRGNCEEVKVREKGEYVERIPWVRGWAEW